MVSDPSRPPDHTSGVKKPYRRPQLTTFGDIREIAANVGMKGLAADGALHGNTKTS